MHMQFTEDKQYGWTCLRCKAVTRCGPKIIIPGDDSETWLSVGQRETVHCPVCQDMKTCEFANITRDNIARVVDAMGRQVYPGAGVPMPPPGGFPVIGAVNAGGVPMATAAMANPAMNYSPPPSPFGAPQQPGAPAMMTMPGQLAPAPPGPGSPVVKMDDTAFERHVASLSDEGVRDLRHDLLNKVQKVEAMLQERRKCIICCERDKSVVFLPCKHQSCCAQCSEKLAECPTCKKKIEDRIVPF